jgi:hypothetical protein
VRVKTMVKFKKWEGEFDEVVKLFGNFFGRFYWRVIL